MRAFHEFETAAEARTYRHQHGTGGWILENEETRRAILFPPDMPPTAIFNHPIARGVSGNLIGCG